MVKKTYCCEILRELLKNCTQQVVLIESKFTSEGIEAEIEDRGLDNQRYILRIEPKETKSGRTESS